MATETEEEVLAIWIPIAAFNACWFIGFIVAFILNFGAEHLTNLQVMSSNLSATYQIAAEGLGMAFIIPAIFAIAGRPSDRNARRRRVVWGSLISSIFMLTMLM